MGYCARSTVHCWENPGRRAHQNRTDFHIERIGFDMLDASRVRLEKICFYYFVRIKATPDQNNG
jgi:hypothetical protein